MRQIIDGIGQVKVKESITYDLAVDCTVMNIDTFRVMTPSLDFLLFWQWERVIIRN